ncbi:uncharacterized protein VTP21DRAFT_2455 [Calcarisporiella thermophila]|uniref:uncharacterized protein n=1 Tax=Calcarisporiella thermophila TaxID=911321 RepID=UPI003743D4F4
MSFDQRTKRRSFLPSSRHDIQDRPTWKRHSFGCFMPTDFPHPGHVHPHPSHAHQQPFFWVEEIPSRASKRVSTPKLPSYYFEESEVNAWEKDDEQNEKVEESYGQNPTTVLEIYDFPATYKTHHLHNIFREYEGVRGGYRIKWLEDTRALILFEHPATAKKAYLENVNNPLAKVKPYTGTFKFRNNTHQDRNGVRKGVAH